MKKVQYACSRDDNHHATAWRGRERFETNQKEDGINFIFGMGKKKWRIPIWG